MTVTYFDQNADGVCGIDFKSEIGGYAFNWKIKNGEVQFLDLQLKNQDGTHRYTLTQLILISR